MMAVTQQSNYSTPQQLPSASHYIYMHSNPPKPLISASSSLQSSQNTAVRNWVKNGDIDKLENLVLEGQGARLLGLTDTTSDTKVKSFLRGIPGYMAKVDLIHDAVIRGSIRELQTLLDKKKLSLARDAVGRGLAHKAVLHSQRSVIEFLARKYPESIQIRDNESRTCLHYSALSKNPTDMYTFLLNLGASPEVIDIHGRKASYYLTNPQELYIEGVNGIPSSNSFKSRNKPRFQSQRRRISPISPKSSPSPPVSQPIQIQSSNSAGSKSPVYGGGGSQITRAQIRIWIHEKDISKLESIVWNGNGDKLLLETTNNPKVRRFLDNVPSLLHHIKLIHTAAIHNDVDGLKEIRSRIEQNNTTDNEVSIARELFTSKDGYGMTAMHKATGLNNRAAAEWLLYEFPSILNLQDNFKRTPMHYGAVRVANDPNSPTSIYSFLKKAGADHTVLDYKQKDPPYYLRSPGDCDSFKFLRNIPDAPRVLTNPERVILGWDRSGVLYRAGAVGAAAALSGNKRKISATSGDEFGDSTMDGEKLEDMEVGSGSKVARTSARDDDEEPAFDENDFLDEEDEIADVGDGYVADSDEGKYELNTEDVVIGEKDTVVEDEEEEVKEAVVEDAGTEKPEEKQEEDEEPEVVESRVPEEPQNEEPEPEESQKADPEVQAEEQSPEEEEPIQQEAAEVEEPEPAAAEEPQEPEAVESEEPQEPEVVESEVPQEPEAIEADVAQEPEVEEPEVPAQPEPAESDELGEVTQLEDPEEQPEIPAQPEAEEMEVEMDEPPADEQLPPGYTEMEESNEESVDAYIQNADMESLVNLVLKGRGHELTNKETPNPEIQEFLNNVPAYMAKINSIHQSAYTGNMRDLQSLLDRKRLAEAQDSVGRGPLHHGVLGNNPQVVRYLVNGYPQCIDLPDGEGRTALHYASVLPDSGTMYKVLIQAGADPNVKDSKGNTPGIYLRRKDLLKLEDLINVADPTRSSSRKRAVKSTLSRTSNVDTWERPETPLSSEPPKNVSIIMIEHDPPPENSDEEEEDDTLELPVQNLSLLNSFYLEVLSKESESIWSKTWRKLTSNNSTDIANKYVRRYLTPKVFNKVKNRSTPRYNSTLLDCIKFYPQFFIVAPDPHAYSSFSDVFMPAILECNGVDIRNNAALAPTVHPGLVLQGSSNLLSDFPIVDLPSKFIHQVRVRVSRNIRPFPFIPIIRKDELYEIQKIVKHVHEQDDYEWYDLETLEKHEREELIEEKGIWFPEATKISRFWPKGRGFLCSESGDVQIWVNAEDHVDLVLTSLYGKLHPLMEKVIQIYDKFADSSEFHYNSQCGYLTVDPFRCGTGIKITFRLRLPNMMQNRSKLIQKCDQLRLTLKWKQKFRLFGSSTEVDLLDWIEVENVRTWGLDENQIVLDVIKGVQELIREEEDMGRAFDRATTKKKEPEGGN